MHSYCRWCAVVIGDDMYIRSRHELRPCKAALAKAGIISFIILLFIGK